MERDIVLGMVDELIADGKYKDKTEVAEVVAGRTGVAKATVIGKYFNPHNKRTNMVPYEVYLVVKSLGLDLSMPVEELEMCRHLMREFSHELGEEYQPGEFVYRDKDFGVVREVDGRNVKIRWKNEGDLTMVLSSRTRNFMLFDEEDGFSVYKYFYFIFCSKTETFIQ